MNQHLRIICLRAIMWTTMEKTAKVQQLSRQDIGGRTVLMDELSLSSPEDGHGEVAWKPADAFYREIVRRPDVRAILERLAKL